MSLIKAGKVRIVKGSKEFEDERGKISNYELTEPINWVGVISSKAGSVELTTIIHNKNKRSYSFLEVM